MMLPIIEDTNTQKQLKRSEQIKKWNEREMMANITNNSQETNDDEIKMTSSIEKFSDSYQRPSRVRFPKGCVFLAACSSGDTDEVRAHLKLGVNINTTNIDGLTALHQACIDANIEMVKFLVDNNADINAQDNEGWTPLHAAVSVGNLEVVKYLINKGARLNICNNDSDLPIDLCDTSNTQMKEFLDDEMKRQNIDADYERKKEELLMYQDACEKKFEDKVHTKTGATPLHVSSAKGYTRVMRILLQSGADVNAVDKDGWTPLHAAAHWEQEEACKILCEYGADFESRNYSEQTPYDVCESEMVNKLKQLEAAYKSKYKLTDVTLNTNKLNTFNKKQSDEIIKPSSVDNKPLVDKEQNKVFLSPIEMPPINSSNNTESIENNNNTNNSTTINKSNEIDKENHVSSNSNSFSNLNGFNSNNNENISKTSTTSIQDTSRPQLTKTPSLNNNINRAKPGLQESLKSLSAQVRMIDNEEKDEEKSSRKQIENSKQSPPITNTNNHSPMTKNLKVAKISFSTFNSNSNSPSNNTLATAKSSTPPTASSFEHSPSPPLTFTINNNNNSNNDNNYNFKSNNLMETSLSRWGPTDTSTTTTATFKRRTAEDIKQPISTTNTTSSIANSSPLSPPSTITTTTATITTTANENTIPSSPNSLNISSNDLNSRRYSSAPIASKDEQAELIRKQKAKLERHFRRSTTAVSYEDIKSAEATIKSGVTTTSSTTPATTTTTTTTTTTNKPEDKTPTSSPISSNTINLTGTNNNSNSNNNNDQPPSTPPPPIPTAASSISLSSSTAPSTNPIGHSGVSSLSTLFGESIKQSNYYHTPATFLSSTNSITPLAQSTSALHNSTSSLIDSQKNLMSKLQIELTPTNNNNSSSSNNNHVNNLTNNSNESTEKDQIIANDIETDKLLNVIEKSKGFSDSKSTTAIRRLRNRHIPIFGLNNIEDNQSGGNNVKKINKLVWNPERLEIEYKEEDQQQQQTASPEITHSETNGINTINSSSSNSKSNLSPEILRKQNSNDTILENNTTNNSTANITNSTSTMNTLALNNTQPHTGRTMFRFDSTPSSSTTSNSNNSSTTALTNSNSSTNSLINRTNIKRSVSQVPSTDRRPIGNTTTATTSSSSFLTSPSSSQSTATSEVKIFDYQAAYEQTKKENETLNQTIIQLKKELEEFKRNQQPNENGTLDKREKRAFDRRISELEEEVKKIDNLKQDNSRLKEENAALIRVISKLSK